MSRKLRFFKDQIDKAGLRCSPRHEIEPDIELGDLEVRIQFYNSVLAEKSLFQSIFCCGMTCFFMTLVLFSCIVNCFLWQRQLADHEHEVLEMNSNSEKLRQTYNELLEFKIVLEKVCVFAFVSDLYLVIDKVI